MAVETTFLLVMIVALILGNALLYFFKPKKNNAMESIVSANVASNTDPIFFPKDAPANEVLLLKSNFKALNEKLNMAHSRMNDLESFSRKEIRELKLMVAELQKEKQTIKVWKAKQENNYE